MNSFISNSSSPYRDVKRPLPFCHQVLTLEESRNLLTNKTLSSKAVQIMVSRLALYIPEHLNAKLAVCRSSNSLVEVYTQRAFQIQNISPELKID